jgi:serine/threonine protein kinase
MVYQIGKIKFLQNTGYFPFTESMSLGEYDDLKGVAIKKISHSSFKITKEIEFIRTFQHQNIIHLYGHEIDENYDYIAMEKAECSLYEYVCYPSKFQNVISYCTIRLILNQVVSGLSFLHSMHIPHRNLKPTNVLLSFLNGRITAMLSDMYFLKSEILNIDFSSFEPPEFSKTNFTDFLFKKKALLEAKAGDIFSLGCVMYYTLTEGKRPFKYRKDNSSQTRKMMFFKEFQIDANPLGLKLIETMLTENPTKRPTIEAIMMHPFFWDDRRCIEFLVDLIAIIKKNENLIKSINELYNSISTCDWIKEVKDFCEKQQRFAAFDGNSIIDLLYFLRYEERICNNDATNLLISFINNKFPKLILNIYMTTQDIIDRKHLSTYYDQDFKFT